MKFDPRIYHRRSIRLKGYNYTKPGAYFVTLCAGQRICLFGEVIGGEVRLSPEGEVVSHAWQALPRHNPRVALGDFIIMPNHLHGIIWLVDHTGKGEASAQVTQHDEEFLWADASPQLAATSGANASPQRKIRPIGTQPGSLGAILQNFKSVSTRKVNQLRASPGVPVWQRNYYEHIIRNEAEMQRIAAYIRQNPLRWQEDDLRA